MSNVPVDVSYDNVSESLELILGCCLGQESPTLDPSVSGSNFGPSHKPASVFTSREDLKREKKNVQDEIDAIHLSRDLLRRTRVDSGKSDGALLKIRDLRGVLQSKELELERLGHTLSPIRLLPTEILRRILALLVPKTLPDDVDVMTPLLAVCRQWTSMIYDMPEMWANISVASDKIPQQEWLARHLHKARVTGINLEWRLYIYCRELVQALLRLAPSWRRFDFDSGSFEFSETDFCEIFEALRRAVSLRELVWRNRPWKNLSEQLTMSLSSVCTLELHGACRLPVGFTLPNVSKLSYYNISVSAAQVQNWSEQFPTLRKMQDISSCLTFGTGTFDEGWNSIIASPPMFPALEELSVDCPVKNTLPACFAAMVGSRNLSIIQIPTSSIKQLNKLAFRMPEMPRVHSVIFIVDSDEEDMKVSAFLRLLPLVENVEMQLLYLNIQDSIMPVLNRISNPDSCGAVLFPRIKGLLLTFNDLTDFSEEVLSLLTYSLLKHLATAGCTWRFLVTVQAREGIIIDDSLPEDFAYLLEHLEECWPTIRDKIHEIYLRYQTT